MTTGFDNLFKDEMKKKISIPANTLVRWQETVDLMLDTMGVPVGLIVKGDPHNEMEILVRRENPENVYLRGQVDHLNNHLFSRDVINNREELLVPNALRDPSWCHSPAARYGMVSYLGVPLIWPNGTIFGAICVLDYHENHYNEPCRKLLTHFQNSVEMGLRVLYDEQRLLQHRKEISRLSVGLKLAIKEEEHVRNCTEELALANEALRDSEARFRTLVDHAPEAMIFVDMDTMTIIDTNDKAEHNFGLSCEKRLNLGTARDKSLQQSNGIRSSKAVLNQISKAVTEGVDKFEWIHCNDSGMEILCEVLLVRLPAVGRNLFKASIIDITELKKAEQALTKSENQFRGIFDNSAMGVILLDLQGRIVSCNPAFCTMIGYSETELTSLRFKDFTFPDDIDISLRGFNELLDGEREHYQFEKRYITKEGKVIWVCLTVSRIGTTESLADFALAMVEDVTEQRNAEQALLQSEERYRTIFDNISDGLSIHDSEGRFIEVNTADCEMHGYSKEEMLALRVSDIVHPNYTEVFNEFKSSIEKTGYFQGEVVQFRKDGTLINIEVKGTTINLQNNTYYLGIVRDITERKRVENELWQYREHLEELVEERTIELASSKEQAEAANRAKSVFLANMSHELRTPLNVILGFSQLMQRDSTLTDSTREKLHTINRSGEHLLRLINDVLEVSKIEAGHITLNRAAFNLYGLLEDIEAMFGMRAEQKRIRFCVERAKDLPCHLVGDDGKLRQVLINLLGNAAKFTDEGAITLRVRAITYPMRSAEQGDKRHWKLIFEVEDTGAGIISKEMNKLFNPFEQTLSGQAKGGTGLGLAISKQYAFLMGGDIIAASTPGKGSLFTFSCRLEECCEDAFEKVEDSKQVVGLAPDVGPKTILVVDDKEESRIFLAELLSLVGFATWEAANGKDALAVFEAKRPDLVLMDMRMPMMDGYEATRRLKATALGGKTPVIAVSASSMANERDEILGTGVDELLCKPFLESELFNAIKRLLGIEFRYAEKNVWSPNPENLPIINPEDIGAMPEELRDELWHALHDLNVINIQNVIQRICIHNKALGEAMRQLEREFQFEMLFNLVKK